MNFKFNDYDLLSTIEEDEINQRLDGQEILIKNVNRGQIIHYDGETCTQLELILMGNVSIERIDYDGNLLNITAFEKGEILGGNLVFSQSPIYPMTVTALENTTLLIIPKDMILQWCVNYTGFLKSYLSYISNHSLILSHKIKDYFDKPLRERLLTYFRRQVLLQHSNTLTLAMSKTALAEYLGVQRTSLSRELQTMRKEGLLDFDGRKITLHTNWSK